MPAAYRLILHPAVRRDVKSIPRHDLQRILNRIEALVDDPRPPGTRKIDDPGVYRIRQGDYRIIYNIDDAQRVVEILRVGHRREVYR
ncbi:MAG: type II toxin-antitoxin system RelE family toxin [Candidatus Acidiferrales bacterium]